MISSIADLLSISDGIHPVLNGTVLIVVSDAIQIGMTGVPVQLVAQDDNSIPVPGLKVRLYDGDTFLTESETDDEGVLSLILEGAAGSGKPYILRLFPPAGYSVPDGLTQTIDVTEPMPEGVNGFEFTFLVTRPSVPVTGDPLMCRLTGYFRDSAKRPIRNLELRFRPREGYPSGVLSGLPFSGSPTVLDADVLTGEVRIKTDRNGYVDFSLPRKSVFDLTVPQMDEFFISSLSSVWIPDLPGIGIQEVLFPYITRITFDLTDVHLQLSGVNTASLVLTAETSNRQENVSGFEVFASLLDLVLDLDVATAKFVAEGVLQITGVSAGSTTLTLNRHPGSAAPRSPGLPDIVLLPETPTITVIA